MHRIAARCVCQHKIFVPFSFLFLTHFALALSSSVSNAFLITAHNEPWVLCSFCVLLANSCCFFFARHATTLYLMQSSALFLPWHRFNRCQSHTHIHTRSGTFASSDLCVLVGKEPHLRPGHIILLFTGAGCASSLFF
uniref:Secreted protein n=1 Tax=Anopheles darlingi TaxID=43151 RepID=A0A2M4D9R3_ANODA